MFGRAALAFMLLTATWSGVTAETFTRDASGVFVGPDYKEAIAIAAGETLTVNSASTLTGEIVVRAGAEAGKLVYRKLLKVDSKTEAAKFAEVIDIELDRDRNGPVLSFHAPADAPWSGTSKSGRLGVEIFLPDGCNLLFNTAYFDIEAKGPFDRFTVTESLSKIDVASVALETDIKVSNRALTASGLKGKLLLSNKYGRIKLAEIDTGEETGIIRNEHGEIIIEKYRGGLDVRTSYNRLVAQGLFLTGDKNRVKNTSAPVLLEFDSLTTGKIRINNQYEQVTVSVTGRLDAAFICKNAENSRIIAENMSIDPTLIYENRLEFNAGKTAAAEVRITTKDAGDIYLSGPGN